MLVIKDLADLKKYLETRKAFAEGQQKATRDARKKGRIGRDESREDLCHSGGMVYAYDESIKAVEALMTNNHDEEK